MSAYRSTPPTEPEPAPIIERPDGYYWQDESGREYGPYASLHEAAQDMATSSDIEYGTVDYESLEDAEAELGLPWIDPQTGEPGEPGIPRLEDH
jgi:hypothetical protein